MPNFSQRSASRLATCDQRLIDLFNAVVAECDCTIIEGHRNRQTQDKYFAEGKSKIKWPFGKHCSIPSQAVDVAPYINGNISWSTSDCVSFGVFVVAKARELGIPLRWGGDWDGDGDRSDQNFNDLVHFELV